VTRRGSRVLTHETLEECFAAFLIAIETPRNKASIRTYEGYGRTFLRFADAKVAEAVAHKTGDKRTAFELLVADEGPEDFGLWRLHDVLRKTVRKELVLLFAFFGWAKKRGKIAEVPARPTLPKGEPGVRSGRQREKPVDLTPAEALAWLAKLPETSPGYRGRPETAYPVRDVILLLWVTGLRPVTVSRLRMPEHWQRGMVTLRITDDIDKVLFGRELPLSPIAVEILGRYAPERPGLIFGHHDYRKHLRRAAVAALGASKGARVARYDLRHGRATDWLERSGGNLGGVAYLLGHRQVTTTNTYTRPRERMAMTVLTSEGDLALGLARSGTVSAQLPAAGESGGQLSDSDPTFTGRGEWIRTTDPQTPSPAVPRNPYDFWRQCENECRAADAETKAQDVGPTANPAQYLSQSAQLIQASWDSLEEAVRAFGEEGS
jgi:integrase